MTSKKTRERLEMSRKVETALFPLLGEASTAAQRLFAFMQRNRKEILHVYAQENAGDLVGTFAGTLLFYLISNHAEPEIRELWPTDVPIQELERILCVWAKS